MKPSLALALVLLALAAPIVADAAGDRGVEGALRQLAEGDTLGAIETLQHTDLERIGDPRWVALLGRLHREQGTIVSRHKSQKVLERAVQLYPDDPGIALEMGLTYFSQTFYPDAVRFFERALAGNPDLCIARYKLGVTHYERWKLRVNSYQDEAEEARLWLGRTLACDPENTDAAIRYVNVTYTIDEPLPAAIAARAFAGRFPKCPEFPLMVAAVNYENENQVAADSAFAAALVLMGEEEWNAYSSLGNNILGYEDMDTFAAALADEQPIMERAYWIGVDPDPTTDINELLLEHMYRTFRADLFYSHASVVTSWTQPQTRGWDTERGEFLVRWGQPDSIYASHGGPRLEVWRYDNSGEGGGSMVIPFVDLFGSGKLLVPSADSEVLMMARWMNQVSEPQKKVVDGGVLDAIAFKDDDFGCSIYVVMHVNADSLLGAINVAEMKHFDLRTRFFDEKWVVEKDDAEELPPQEMTMLPGSKYRLFDVVRRYRMPFGRYHVACALADDMRMARAVERGNCDATHLADSRLISSEILFLREETSGASFTRSGELLTPNPWRAYGGDQAVSIYFEIYNLTVVDRRSRYRVTYEIHDDPEDTPGPWHRLGKFVSKVTRLDKGAPSVAQSFDREGDSYRAGERMVIDVSMLPAGRHRLWVTIRDLNNENEWETSRSFHRTAPSLAVSE